MVAAPGVLGNDQDEDEDQLTAVLNTLPANGFLNLELDGSFVYTPTSNFNGLDSFSYHTNDGSADSDVAVVSLTVTAQNDPPVAAADSYSTIEDSPLTISVPGVLVNDSDPDGDQLVAVLDSPPLSGTLRLQPEGSFVFMPTLGMSGEDGFTYHADDGQAISETVMVVLTVVARPREGSYLTIVINSQSTAGEWLPKGAR